MQILPSTKLASLSASDPSLSYIYDNLTEPGPSNLRPKNLFEKDAAHYDPQPNMITVQFKRSKHDGPSIYLSELFR
jgi:hypothetical protein